MAKLDRFLSALSEYKAEALVLQQDQPPAFRFLSGSKPVSKTSIDSEQLLTLISELATPAVIESFRQDGTTSFTYQLGMTSYTGILEEDAGNLVATLWETSKDIAREETLNRAEPGSGPVIVAPDTGPASRAGNKTKATAGSAAPKATTVTSAPKAGAGAGAPKPGAGAATPKAGASPAAARPAAPTAGHPATAPKAAAPKAGAPKAAAAKPAAGAAVSPSHAAAASTVVPTAARSAAPPAGAASTASAASGVPSASGAPDGLAFQIGWEDHAIPDDLPSHCRADMDALLRATVERGASDLHLSCGNPPIYRVDGVMSPDRRAAPLSPEPLFKMLFSITPRRNRDQYLMTRDTDFAYAIEGLSRFRVNLFHDRHGPGAVCRAIPNEIIPAEKLGLSPAVRELAQMRKGLVLVTGPTGSGKSTTLAAILDLVNKQREDHVITIEDPIEFVHPNKKCLINQREVGIHTGSFKTALRAALREDPDVVLVGEMRDLETIAIAVETAVTGHLVFGTLHTTTAAATVDRLIDQFPHEQQDQVRVMLADSLRAVISQTLVRRKGGGRVAAMEILLCTNAVSNLIRESKTFQIEGTMQTSKGIGMQTLNDHLLELVRSGQVDVMEAYLHAVDKLACKDLFTRNGLSVGKG